MKQYWLYFLIIGFFALVTIVAFSKRTIIPRQSLTRSFSTDFAYDNRTFLHAVSEVKEIDTSTPRVVVLPHHLLASPIIASGVSMIAKQTPSVILILSPNHLNIGQCDITTSKNGWDTPFGQLEVETSVQNKFLDSRTACIDDQAIEKEHGIAGLLPFIKYYLPNTKIVPLALKKDISPELFNLFTQKLIETSEGSVVLASIDFSHGLDQRESLKRDSITKNHIEKRNYTEITKLSSVYLDSPLSLVAALKVIDSSESEPNFLIHSDASSFNNSPNNVTSYFLISGGTNPSTNSISTTVIPAKAGIHQISPYPNANTFTLLFAGDVMLGRSVNTRMVKYSDYSWPFRKISEILSAADLTLINLESPIRSGCKPTDSGMIFCADPKSVEGLVTAGVDIANLANNHIDNQGKVGIDETISILKQNNITPIGAVDSALTPIFTVKKTKISFVGFDDIQPVPSAVTSAIPENIQKLISSAKKSADLVVATFHWGNEYSPHSSRQKTLAHLAIDSGADLVIGHHPHWVQASEIYKDKPIYYSLGNLVFDQMWSENTREGLIVKFTYDGVSLVNTEEIPIKIFDYGQPALQK